jgi:hypothetical protein
MTFLELKQRLESLTPEQLAEPVRWWGDERGGTIDDLHVLDEEYVNVGDGFEPRSTANVEHEDDITATLPAGTPTLVTDR